MKLLSIVQQTLLANFLFNPPPSANTPRNYGKTTAVNHRHMHECVTNDPNTIQSIKTTCGANCPKASPTNVNMRNTEETQDDSGFEKKEAFRKPVENENQAFVSKASNDEYLPDYCKTGNPAYFEFCQPPSSDYHISLNPPNDEQAHILSSMLAVLGKDIPQLVSHNITPDMFKGIAPDMFEMESVSGSGWVANYDDGANSYRAHLHLPTMTLFFEKFYRLEGPSDRGIERPANLMMSIPVETEKSGGFKLADKPRQLVSGIFTNPGGNVAPSFIKGGMSTRDPDGHVSRYDRVLFDRDGQSPKACEYGQRHTAGDEQNSYNVRKSIVGSDRKYISGASHKAHLKDQVGSLSLGDKWCNTSK